MPSAPLIFGHIAWCTVCLSTASGSWSGFHTCHGHLSNSSLDCGCWCLHTKARWSCTKSCARCSSRQKKHFLLNFKVFLHALSSKSTCGTKHSSLNRKLTYQKRVCKRSWTSTKRLKTLSKWRKEDVNPATNKRKLTDSQVVELLHPWSLSQRLVSRAV